MFVNQLPDPRLFNSRSGDPGNLVICASTCARYHYPDHVTPYLLVANFKNPGHYKLNGRAAFVDDRCFYFLNAGDRLEIDFKQREPLETMLVLFSGQLIREAASCRSQTADGLLDNYAEIRSPDVHIPDIPFAYNAAVMRYISQLRCKGNQEDPESVLFELLDAVWTLNENGKAGLAQIAARRKSTREELYRRLFAAELYMRDHCCERLSVDEIAREACMNKFHFLKSFKSRYGVSPHRYVVQLKLEHARILLASGKYGVSDACLEVGFESPGTFTHLYKRTYGHLPSKFPISNK